MPHDLILVRQLPAPPLNVFRCWTEPELLKRFFAPEPGETVVATIDLVPGGRFYTMMRFETYGDIPTEGCVLLVDPGRRFVFTDTLTEGFRPSPKPFFTADITFTAKDGGCEYRVLARHADAETAARHEEMGFSSGWGTVADQLGRLAATL
ncbi:SRPBCC family protein [Chachezhania sediminis]|uniref:SRPBCC family protein n=1 Tax=Chachezhania sediminis TaxID=2599291 RepID=UPI00131E87F5|nr:SRPBCC family protein [Chachezhania sediminis]